MATAAAQEAEPIPPPPTAAGANSKTGAAKNQLFAAGGHADQNDTGARVAIAPDRGTTLHVESEEAVTLSGQGGDDQLTKGPDVQGIANANPEFNHRDLVKQEEERIEGAQSGAGESETFVIADGLPTGHEAAFYGPDPDQFVIEETHDALDRIMDGVYSKHKDDQYAARGSTASNSVSTTRLTSRNPFARRKAVEQDSSAGDGESGGGGAADSGATPSNIQDAAKEDNLDYYFADSDPEDGEGDDVLGGKTSRTGPLRHDRRYTGSARGSTQPYGYSTAAASFNSKGTGPYNAATGLRRTGQRTTQSSITRRLADLEDMDEVRKGFAFVQNAQLDWDAYDGERTRQAEQLDDLRFPGAKYLAYQGAGLSKLSTQSKRDRSKAAKKSNTSTLSGSYFA